MAETKRHLRGQTLSPSESIELPRDAAPVATLARPARDRIERLADPDAKENVEFARKSGCILIEDRSYFYRVGGETGA